MNPILLSSLLILTGAQGVPPAASKAASLPHQTLDTAESDVLNPCGVMVVRYSKSSSVRVPIVSVAVTVLGGKDFIFVKGIRGHVTYTVAFSSMPAGGGPLGAPVGQAPYATLNIDDGSDFGNPNYSSGYSTLDSVPKGSGFGELTFNSSGLRYIGEFRFAAAKAGLKNPDVVVDGMFDTH